MSVYDYLETEEMDDRFRITADYLKKNGFVSQRKIVDINAGTSRILKFLHHDFINFSANDINPECEQKNIDNYTFWNLPDDKFAQFLGKTKIDVLLAFGLTGREATASTESKTIVDSVIQIVNKNKPKVLVLETSKVWEQNYHPVNDILKGIKGYINDYGIICKNPNHPLGERSLRILRRETDEIR